MQELMEAVFLVFLYTSRRKYKKKQAVSRVLYVKRRLIIDLDLKLLLGSIRLPSNSDV